MRAVVGRRDTGTAHCYTIESSCNLRPHSKLVEVLSTVEQQPQPTDAVEAPPALSLRCSRMHLPLESQLSRHGKVPSPPRSGHHGHNRDHGHNRSHASVLHGRGYTFMCHTSCFHNKLMGPEVPWFHSSSGAKADEFHCTRWCCPLDPPSVFAGVGQAIAHAWLDMSECAPADAPPHTRLSRSPFLSFPVRSAALACSPGLCSLCSV